MLNTVIGCVNVAENVLVLKSSRFPESPIVAYKYHCSVTASGLNNRFESFQSLYHCTHNICIVDESNKNIIKIGHPQYTYIFERTLHITMFSDPGGNSNTFGST